MDLDDDGISYFDGEALASASILEVHKVGCLEASFVPCRSEFSRLDKRFRLPDQVWDDLPLYQDYGFVVFKLAKGKNQEVHPMAFRFPTRIPETLFFPTIHVHDGEYHETAEFDHTLYCQNKSDVREWEKSVTPLSQVWDDYVHMNDFENILKIVPTEWDQEGPMVTVKRYWFGYKNGIFGSHKNRDILVQNA